ncbi:unnamed protein product [Diatraea saccharalis]|uniref:BTB domain-containing protein n=1 Tax=Diatraea saccharalis TaxID=40085 RepID=A0A9N9WHI4_9NEOP|nr:unnamed protein product [Diatraea saccharalis]
MRFSVLKCLVEFMYCGKTQCLEENLDELVSAAQFLKIKGLSKVTKEGLGITNQSELPVFTPPVVINRPPQSLIDLHSQQDMVLRIPFDIENGGNAAPNVDYVDGPRAIKPRRGRPSVRRSGGWETSGILGRAAERALMRREQDSRKAIHQLKHLQTRHMQDYMDRVTLSQAVNSICGPDNSNNHGYINLNNDLMYMDQTASANVLDPAISYSKEHSIGNETITSSYANTTMCSTASEPTNSGIGNAMSQYVNALKNAGLPTDLPILFESGDGSYINVNEQVLLDMVQSSEIQYEVIEQPNIIEKVADPSEIKSIDDLSKSIERGEILLGTKGYNTNTDFGKDTSQYSQQEEVINSLNSILPDNLESFAEQQNFVVLDPPLQENNNSLDHDNAHDFSGIDSDMQFFTKSMSDDVKKYYEDHQLNDARVMEQLCPASTSLDTSFSMSLLDTKTSNMSETLTQQYNPLNPDDDFGLQLPQNTDDTLDCLMTTPKQADDETSAFADSHLLHKTIPEKDDIMKDLMNIENNVETVDINSKTQNFTENSLKNIDLESANDSINNSEDLSENINSGTLQWDSMDISTKETSNRENENMSNNCSHLNDAPENQFRESVIDLTDSLKVKSDWENIMNDNDEIMNKENCMPNENINCTLEEDIPYAVGLLPLKKELQTENENIHKRKNSIDVDTLDNVDAKCLKRKIKYKKL